MGQADRSGPNGLGDGTERRSTQSGHPGWIGGCGEVELGQWGAALERAGPELEEPWVELGQVRLVLGAAGPLGPAVELPRMDWVQETLDLGQQEADPVPTVVPGAEPPSELPGAPEPYPPSEVPEALDPNPPSEVHGAAAAVGRGREERCNPRKCGPVW